MLAFIIAFVIVYGLFVRDKNSISGVLFPFIGKCILALGLMWLLVNFTVPLFIGVVGLAVYMVYYHYSKRKESKATLAEDDNIDPYMPKKPKLKKPSLGEWVFILIWLPLGILFYFVGVENMGTLAFAYIVICGGLSVLLYYAIVIQDYNKKMKEYECAMKEYKNKSK